jgi:Helix-turn-helix domain
MARQVAEDPKLATLRASRTLNPRPEAVVDPAFLSSPFCDARDLAQVKYEMVRRVRVDTVPVARAAAAFGYSRQAFYQVAAALDAAGPAGLVPGKPGPRGGHKLTERVVDHLRELLAADPELSSVQLAAAVLDRFSVRVHPRSVERALARREARDREPNHR